MKRVDAGNEGIRSASIAELFGKKGDAAAAALASALKEKRTVPVVVKADVQGSLEALTTALEGMVAEDDVAQVGGRTGARRARAVDPPPRKGKTRRREGVRSRGALVLVLARVGLVVMCVMCDV